MEKLRFCRAYKKEGFTVLLFLILFLHTALLHAQGFSLGFGLGPNSIFSSLLFNPYDYGLTGSPFWTAHIIPPLRYLAPVLLPCGLAPMPLICSAPRLQRRAAATTILPSALLLSPTALLASFLFSPLPATTTITNTAVFPGTVPTGVVPNNVSSNTIQNYNYATTVTTTPILPGLTSLFLPLLL